MQDQISYTQLLTILDAQDSSMYEVEIDIDELIESHTIKFQDELLRLSNDTVNLIRGWLHEKKTYQLELLEQGELENRAEKIKNLNNWQQAVSQAIMKDKNNNN